MQRTIDVHISNLLYHQECVIVPTFGAFITRHYAAELNPSTHMMRPAGKRVSFNAMVNQNDGLLAQHISKSEGITYNEALESITISVRGWKKMLKSGKKVNLPLVGRLYLDKDALIQFNPSVEVNYDVFSFGLGIFRAPSVQREVAIEQNISHVIAEHKTKNGGKINYRPMVRWAAAIGVFVALGIYASSTFEGIEYKDFSSLVPFSGNKAPVENITPAEPEVLEEVEVSPVVFEIEETEGTETTETDKSVFNSLDEVSKKNDNGNSGFHIIVGSFKEQANAEKYMRTLNQSGYSAYVANGNSKFHRVAVGNFNTRNQADKMLRKVKAQINSAAWVYRN